MQSRRLLTVLLAALMISQCFSVVAIAEEQESPVEISMLCMSYSEVPDMNGPFWTEFQRLTNSKLNIQFIPTGEFSTKLDLMLAAADFPEVVTGINVNAVNIGNAIREGAFWDLTPFLGDFSQYPNLGANYETGVFDYAKVDGKIYGIPSMRAMIDPSIKLRKDWLDKLGIPVPTTMDEYKEALKAIVNGDPDGNGQKDTLGFIQHGFATIDTAFLVAFGGFQPTYDDEGGMIYKNLTPQYEDLIGWMNGLYAEGLIAKEWSVMKNTQAEELFTTGMAASYERNIWRDYPFQTQIQKVQPDAEVISLPPLKGPGGYAAWLQSGYIGMGVISRRVPEAKVERILRYYEATATEELNFHVYNGIEGVHHTVVDGQPQLTELGVAEVTATCQQPAALISDPWIKTVTMQAPKAYNDAKKEEVAIYAQVGEKDPFAGIVSETWLEVWSKYDSEWQEMTVKAVNGVISLDEYHTYVEALRSDPDIKQAFQEFAQAYETFIGK
ncbi:MAG: extracellular solute-binding protein [Oscillospiraceae bacterium]|jgi:putative aldouronate transport system substrate-binding protein|nr:extracellular solute-binding protein [Oscillospiraceae bacterium]